MNRRFFVVWEDASGDIGDSTITETAGIGAFAMAAAPAIVDSMRNMIAVGWTYLVIAEIVAAQDGIAQGVNAFRDLDAIAFGGHALEGVKKAFNTNDIRKTL